MESIVEDGMKELGLSIPRAPGFSLFLEEIQKSSPPMDYVWSKPKEASCDWIISRISGGRGVDIGGTPYLYHKLRDKGCDMAIYDQYLDDGFENAIRDDMINVLDHFEPDSLDFITTRHTLEHAVCALFQIWAYHRILKMNGRLFVIVPMHCKEWVWFGTHHSCLPHENWVMMFHRMGFKVKASDAGSWSPGRSYYIEWRFELEKDTQGMRL